MDASPIEKTHGDEFLLSAKDVPQWAELPEAAILEKHFALDWVHEKEYRQGRILDDPEEGFTATDKALKKIEYALDDDLKRQALLSIIPSEIGKTSFLGRIISIVDPIAQKKLEDVEHLDYLNTREVLEFFDENEVRPGTLKELLAYSKLYWRPLPNYPSPDYTLTNTQEDNFLPQNAPYIYALGSIFTDSEGNDRVPYLYGRLGERGLEAEKLDYLWSENDRFLVFRKQ